MWLLCSKWFLGRSFLNIRSNSAAVLLTYIILLSLQESGGQNQDVPEKLAQFDRIIQGYAFKAFKHPKTGIIYNATLPSSLLGVRAEAVRLRSGSLRRRGFSFNEFTIPIGGLTDGIPRSVVLVYREFTAKLYPLPDNYTLASPVLGLKVYNAFNLSSTDALPELNFVAKVTNITVRIPFSTMAGITPLCAAFDTSGKFTLTNVTTSPNVCSTNHLGDFALIVPSLGPAAAPFPAPPAATPDTSDTPQGTGRRRKRFRKWRVVVSSVVGGFVGVLLLFVLLVTGLRHRNRSRMTGMEKRSDRGEMLQTALIGSGRAPTAGASRTRPVLENEYAAT